MRACLLTPAARNDLAEIWDYTAARWSIDQAERYIRAIAAACQDVADERKQGRPVPEIREGYFQLAVGSHFLFYRLTAGNDIEVVRILHQRMDVPQRLLH
jgi:toxin ParE1/3/4